MLLQDGEGLQHIWAKPTTLQGAPSLEVQGTVMGTEEPAPMGQRGAANPAWPQWGAMGLGSRHLGKRWSDF